MHIAPHDGAWFEPEFFGTKPRTFGFGVAEFGRREHSFEMLRTQPGLRTPLSNVIDVKRLTKNGSQGYRQPKNRSASAFLAAIDFQQIYASGYLQLLLIKPFYVTFSMPAQISIKEHLI
jgi:hypothetical protein